MTSETFIKQFGVNPIRDFTFEYNEYVYSIINNLIDTDIPKNKKLIFIMYLMCEKSIVFFNDEEGNFEIGKLARPLTYDKNRLPVDISIHTLNGDVFNRKLGEYVMMYNPIPISYLWLKIAEMAKIERVIDYRRKLYKVPIVFKGKAALVDKIKKFINKLFYDTDEVCTLTNKNSFTEEDLTKIDLDIEYITDKLLDESESIKEDILEILGIYKNTSGNRERVNETELMVANSNTTISKLGFEDTLDTTFNEISEVLKHDFRISLNINKVFDIKKGDNNE